jgi:hypothetical protein
MDLLEEGQAAFDGALVASVGEGSAVVEGHPKGEGVVVAGAALLG